MEINQSDIYIAVSNFEKTLLERGQSGEDQILREIGAPVDDAGHPCAIDADENTGRLIWIGSERAKGDKGICYQTKKYGDVSDKTAAEYVYLQRACRKNQGK
ncbi:MAG: hypothetical protein HY602_01525 [Parcubacteria group bacterium]|nr:hypothetical protein [Parcubacteria group bacterium]